MDPYKGPNTNALKKNVEDKILIAQALNDKSAKWIKTIFEDHITKFMVAED